MILEEWRDLISNPDNKPYKQQSTSEYIIINNAILMINGRDDVNSLATVCIRPFILGLKWINNNEVT